MGYARAAAALAQDFDVFPATEAALTEARAGRFAGCISATVNLNSDLCARAYHDGDADALAQATAIRNLMNGTPLIAAVKALLAHIHADPAWARVAPPLSGLSAEDRATIVAGYDRIREASRAA
jgi:4-hydroxy-tetrahydrodipicolinate synthase